MPAIAWDEDSVDAGRWLHTHHVWGLLLARSSTSETGYRTTICDWLWTISCARLGAALARSAGGTLMSCRFLSLAQAKSRSASNLATNSSRRSCDEKTITVFACCHAFSQKFSESSQHQTGSPVLGESEKIIFV